MATDAVICRCRKASKLEYRPIAFQRYKPSAGSVQSVLKPISGSVEQLKSVADNGEQREVLLQSNRSSVHSFARSSLLRTSEQSTEMRRSALSLAAQVRVPMIKFLGARLPRPRFDP
ncbi:unnamed protein product [Toxocara canis]|uniref:Uncharacterized protein n=1 Tax=Toxocara canis TaxID=6265 RepID=A0A183V0Z2_TOXCA|nr:unnamed protein product [Toxocara canis]